ncbi:hypothetical protein VTK56DRAFT_2058 [Thermocarpiscus australiensis]
MRGFLHFGFLGFGVEALFAQGSLEGNHYLLQGPVFKADLWGGLRHHQLSTLLSTTNNYIGFLVVFFTSQTL